MWPFKKRESVYKRISDRQKTIDRLVAEKEDEARLSAYESFLNCDAGSIGGDQTVMVLKYYENIISFWNPRHLTPCKYCMRYDSKVIEIDSDGLHGYYHPFCHSEVLRVMREELAKRMNGTA